MNRKFSLPATPAMARRILALAHLNKGVVISPEIHQLAAQDDSASTVEQKVIQYLHDVDFRALVVGTSLSTVRSTVLEAALLHGVRPIMVHIDVSVTWMATIRAAKQSYHLVNSSPVTEIADSIYIGDIYHCDYLMKMGRGGLLIAENISGNLDSLSKEFTKFVMLFVDDINSRPSRGWPRGRHDTLLSEMAAHIVPSMFLPILDRDNTGAFVEAMRQGNSLPTIKRIAPLLNITMDLLES